jgi:hypothetical protein
MVHLIWYCARLFGEKILGVVEFIEKNPRRGGIVAECNVP